MVKLVTVLATASLVVAFASGDNFSVVVVAIGGCGGGGY